MFEFSVPSAGELSGSYLAPLIPSTPLFPLEPPTPLFPLEPLKYRSPDQFEE